MHPLASAGNCNEQAASHTLSRSAVLGGITDDTNHVWHFPANAVDEGAQPRRVGWRQASTVGGFCARHDHEMFRPLEDARYEGTREQVVLLAYRAVCFELDRKEAALHAMPYLRDHLDRGKPPAEQRQIQQRLATQLAGFSQGVRDLHTAKECASQQLATQQLTGWSFCDVSFEGSLDVASTGTPAPNRDLAGLILQDLARDPPPMQLLYVAPARTTNGWCYVFAWRSAQRAPQRFIDSLLALPERARPSTIVEYCFAFIGNTFFSGAWWDSLSPSERTHVHGLAQESNSFYFPPAYRATLPVTWRTVAVSEIRSF